MLTLKYLILLIVVSFLPPIIYAVWIRNTERYHREKWKPIFLAFIWGASIAIIASIILEILLQSYLPISIKEVSLVGFVTAVVLAPFAEELTKPLAMSLKSIKKEVNELEDGLIYGAVAGLGFSATENLLYGAKFLSEGIFIFFVLMTIRSFGACLLHASATAWTGYGYGKTIMKHTSLIRVFPYFILAMLIHAFYNFVLFFQVLGATIGLFSALIFAAFTIRGVRNKIKKLDQVNR